MTEVDTTDNGDGTYTYDFEICTGYEDTWGFYFTFTGPGNLVSWDGSVTSPSTGVTINASVPPVSGNGDIEYGDYDDTGGSVFSGTCCDDCVVISFTFDDPITDAEVDGVQYIYGPCSGTPSDVSSCFESVSPNGINATSDPICPGGSSDLSVDGGDLVAPSASWEWYSGSCGGTNEGSGSSITVSPSSTTTYYVRAESNCDTTKCASSQITVNSESTAPTGASATTNPICPGNSTDLSVSGGSLGTGASWEWYSGSCGGTSVGSGSPLTVSPSSTTTYYVRAEGTCNTTTCESVTVDVNSASTAPTSASASTNPICKGSSTDLSLSGGSLGTGASWEWYRGSCGGTAVGSGSPLTVSPSSTTTYYVRAEGTCNTTTCESVTVDVVPQPTIDAGPDRSICNGDTVQIGGSPTANGGTTPYSYSWSNGGSLNDDTIANPNAFPSSNTTYTVNLTDSNGCNGSDQMTVMVDPLPSVSFTGLAGPYCNNVGGDTLTGNQAPGGVFSGPAGVSDLGSGKGYFDPNGLSAGTYEVYYSYTDGNGCTNVDTQSTVVHGSPTLDSSNVTITNATCGNSDGAIEDITVSGGSTPYNFQWENSSGSAVGSNLDLTGVPVGDYTLYVTDDEGCADTLGVFSVINLSGPNADAGPDDRICKGDTIPIGGSPTASGGVPPYSYSWSNGFDLASDTVANPDAFPTSGTNFTVTVTDSNGCVDSDQMSLAVDAPAKVEAGPDTAICGDDTVALNGGYGGSASSSTWSGSGDGSFADPSDTITTYRPGSNDTSSGSVRLTLTSDDPSGPCPAVSDSMELTFDPLPVPKTHPDTNICSGDSAELWSSGGSTYVWNTGATSDSIDVSPMQDSIYSVLLIGSKGCDVMDSTLVKVDRGGSAQALPDSIEIKAEGSKDIDVFVNDIGAAGTISVVDSSDKGALTYSGSGSFNYSAEDRKGEDSFSYRICDGACMLECDTARVKVRITKDVELFIPNGVSANGDGLNDRWKIRGLEAYPENSVRIMNRWGQEVYRASPYENDWRGQGVDGEVTEGTFFYILDLGPGKGKKSGYLEFLR